MARNKRPILTLHRGKHCCYMICTRTIQPHDALQMTCCAIYRMKPISNQIYIYYIIMVFIWSLNEWMDANTEDDNLEQCLLNETWLANMRARTTITTITINNIFIAKRIHVVQRDTKRAKQLEPLPHCVMCVWIPLSLKYDVTATGATADCYSSHMANLSNISYFRLLSFQTIANVIVCDQRHPEYVPITWAETAPSIHVAIKPPPLSCQLNSFGKL